MAERFPDFIVLGAPKAGTTSIYFYLKQHPDIFLPTNKEPGFFAFENMDMDQFYYPKPMNVRTSTLTDRAKYTQQFAEARTDQKSGDMSTIYLSSPNAPAAIKKYDPNAKMVAILRNPVARTFSHFTHLRIDGLEPAPNIITAVNAEKERIAQNCYPSYFYTQASFYSQQLERYYAIFPKENIKVILYEDLKNMDQLLVDLFTFIGVDPSVPIDSTVKFNVTGRIPRFPWLHQMLRGDKSYKKGIKEKLPVTKWASIHALYDRVMLGEPAKITAEEEKFLATIFVDDIKKTSELIGRDLSGWLNGYQFNK